MTVIPVMDIKNGKVVRGVEGNREEYKPIESKIAEDSKPLTVFNAFKKNYDFEKLYIADIDALENQGSNLNQIKQLSNFEGDLIVDTGFRSIEELDEQLIQIVDKYVVASESLKSFKDLEDIVANYGSSKIIFSLDIRNGEIKTNLEVSSADEILVLLRNLGIKEVIILDISNVGTESGISSQVKDILENDVHDFEFISGGGVRDFSDYREFLDEGVEGVLISTSLHNRGFEAE